MNKSPCPPRRIFLTWKIRKTRRKKLTAFQFTIIPRNGGVGREAPRPVLITVRIPAQVQLQARAGRRRPYVSPTHKHTHEGEEISTGQDRMETLTCVRLCDIPKRPSRMESLSDFSSSASKRLNVWTRNSRRGSACYTSLLTKKINRGARRTVLLENPEWKMCRKR